MRWRGLVLVVVVVAAGVVAWVVRARTEHDSGSGAATAASPASPPLPERATLLGSDACRDCHEEQHATWQTTTHADALRDADDGTIVGRFDGEPIETPAFVATPYRQGRDYLIRVDRKDRRPSGIHTVTRVVGRSLEQVYLATGPRGAWRVLPICWNVERAAWDRTADVLDALTGHVGAVRRGGDTMELAFNDGCASCHATGFDAGYDAENDVLRSTVREDAVGCESCHGPGSIHVAWHRRGVEAEVPAAARLPERDAGAKDVLASCGRCHYLHEWRYAIELDPRVGLFDVAVSRNHDRPGFFADGRLSALGYHGTTQSQSACFRGGLSCLDCHQLHGGRPFALKWEDAATDEQCAACHAAVVQQGRAHTFHDDVRCVDCHMPRLLEGVLHRVRDHALRSPRPELTERFGADAAPNACNACHRDEDAAWARAAADGWWKPMPRPRLAEVAQVVALRRDPKGVATTELAATASDPEVRLFFRTTALRALAARDDPDARAALRAALDPAAAPDLLQLACASLAARPDPAAIPALRRLLSHDARTVRVEAAYALGLAGYQPAEPASVAAVQGDAQAMLVRQRPSPAILRRVGVVADLAGALDELGFAVRDLRAVRAADDVTRYLVHRVACRLTEAERHDDALRVYAEVRELGGGKEPDRLWLDSADSLLAVGDAATAASNWREIVRAHPGEDDFLHVVAAARLAGLDGDAAAGIARLEALETQLAADPSRAHDLARVRWSLAWLRKSG